MNDLNAQLDPLIGQIVVAAVGFVLTALLGFLSWATLEARQWMKAKKLTTLRRIFDGVIINAKKAVTPELLEQGERAVARYLESYAKQTASRTLQKMNVDDNALAQRMLTEAAAMVRVYIAVNAEQRNPQKAANVAALGYAPTGEVQQFLGTDALLPL